MLTRVNLLFLPEFANDWLRFGDCSYWRPLDKRRAIAAFAPDAVFAYVRWRAGNYGTKDWRVLFCRAGRPGDLLQKIPGVYPGAELLCYINGKKRVQNTLAFIDSLEGKGYEPQRLPPSYWRCASVQLLLGNQEAQLNAAKFSAQVKVAALAL